MQTFTLLFSFIGLLSAGPQYHLPSTYYIGGYPTVYGAIQYASPVVRYLPYNADIITQSRSLADSVKTTLRQLAADPNSAVIVNRIINDKDNICLNSLEEGIASIETATSLLERARGDIKAIIAKVKTFVNLSDPS